MPISTELSTPSTIAPLPRRMIFVILAAFLGFIAGISVGASVVPDGVGLAGPAFAVSYGVAGFWIAAVAAFIVTRRMVRPIFRRALLTLCAFSLLVWSWVAWRAVTVGPRPQPAPTLVQPIKTVVPGSPTSPG